MDHDDVRRWVADYERAWRTAGTDELGALFTDEATYRTSPWADPVVGLPAIRGFWDAERDGPDEAFTMTAEVVAVDEAVAVVRAAVDYEKESSGRWRDLWIIRFDGDGRCVAFEEWPFAPDQPDGPDQPDDQ